MSRHVCWPGARTLRSSLRGVGEGSARRKTKHATVLYRRQHASHLHELTAICLRHSTPVAVLISWVLGTGTSGLHGVVVGGLPPRQVRIHGALPRVPRASLRTLRTLTGCEAYRFTLTRALTPHWRLPAVPLVAKAWWTRSGRVAKRPNATRRTFSRA